MWHPNVGHAVEDEHQGTGYSNVIYIGSAPYCANPSAVMGLNVFGHAASSA